MSWRKLPKRPPAINIDGWQAGCGQPNAMADAVSRYKANKPQMVSQRRRRRARSWSCIVVSDGG